MKRNCVLVTLILFICIKSFAADYSVQLKEAEGVFNSRNQMQSIPMFEKLILTLETEAQQRNLDKKELFLLARSYDLLGQAQFNNNEQSKASSSFLKLIEWNPDYKMNEDLVSKKIVDLLNEVKRDNLAMLTVRSTPENATVLLDGRYLANASFENQSVIKGKHKLEIRARGYQPQLRDIDISAGAMQEITVQLAEDPTAIRLAEIESSLKEARSSSDTAAEAKALIELGKFHVEQDQLDIAGREFDRAQRLFHEIGNYEGEALALLNLANIQERNGAVPRARETLESAVSVSRKTQNSELLAETLQTLARLAYQANDTQSAKGYDEEAVELFQKLGESEKLKESQTRLQNISTKNRTRGGELLREAFASMNAGNYSDAEKKYQEALTVAREAGDKSSQGNALLNLGFLFSSSGRESQAMPFLEEALNLSRDTGDKSREALCLYNLAIAAFNRGDRSKADELYEESATIYRKLGDNPRKKLW